jgi:hypothetical protein
VAVRQSLRPATGSQVRVVAQYLAYRDARLVLTAEAPERSTRNVCAHLARVPFYRTPQISQFQATNSIALGSEHIPGH